MALSFAKAGASYIAIGARSNLEKVEQDIISAATGAGREKPQVLCLSMDVVDEKSVNGALEKIDQAFGKLDVVICNAAIIGDRVPMIDSTPDSWWRTCKARLIVPCGVQS
jgi:NAD(P)-dependent dehydrogenase (short-subunit alcohol dehydrogenase family)